MQTTGGQSDPMFVHLMGSVLQSVVPLYGLVKVISMTRDKKLTAAHLKELFDVEKEVRERSQRFVKAACDACGPEVKLTTFFGLLIQSFALDLALECEKALNQDSLVITRRSNVSS